MQGLYMYMEEDARGVMQVPYQASHGGRPQSDSEPRRGVTGERRNMAPASESRPAVTAEPLRHWSAAAAEHRALQESWLLLRMHNSEKRCLLPRCPPKQRIFFRDTSPPFCFFARAAVARRLHPARPCLPACAAAAAAALPWSPPVTPSETQPQNRFRPARAFTRLRRGPYDWPSPPSPPDSRRAQLSPMCPPGPCHGSPDRRR